MSRQEEEKCTLSNKELISKCREWNDKLCHSGGDDWTLQVPANHNHDPDLIIMEVCDRLEAKIQKLQEIEGTLKEVIKKSEKEANITSDKDEHYYFIGAAEASEEILQLITKAKDE